MNVVEVNDVLLDTPEAINGDPYGEGWMIKVRPYDSKELKDLMDYEEYSEYVEKEMDE